MYRIQIYSKSKDENCTKYYLIKWYRYMTLFLYKSENQNDLYDQHTIF